MKAEKLTEIARNTFTDSWLTWAFQIRSDTTYLQGLYTTLQLISISVFSRQDKAHTYTHDPPLEAFFHARKKCLVRSDMTELYARSSENGMVLRRMKVKSSHYVSLLKIQNEIIIIIKMMAWDLHRDWCTECSRECWTVSLVIILNFITSRWKIFHFMMKWKFSLTYMSFDLF